MSSIPTRPHASPRPRLFTFDVFGTVLDWRAGLTESLRRRGIALGHRFDDVIDRQGEIEAGAFATYREITAHSLIDVLGIAVPVQVADEIGREVGRWPLYPDSAGALRTLMRAAPCVALTNSDRAHGEDVQTELGFPLSFWLCAEEVGVYKPNPRFWEAARDRVGVPFGPEWWHVSAYADYDLGVARDLGLTTVFVRRPHARPPSGKHPADLTVADLDSLATEVSRIL